MNRIRIGVAVAAAGLLVALAGCTSSSPTENAAQDSPLSKYLSALYGGDMSEEEMVAQSERDNREREELTAKCMAEEGFEYLPVIYDGSMSFSSGEEWKPDDREWVAQYGYGMVNWPGRDEQVDPPTDGEEWVDPNQEYVESLSESEMTAYYEALYGPTPTEEEMSEDGSYEWNWETSGCSGWAQHEMEGENPLSSEAHKPIMDAINEFYMSMETAPEYADLNSEWAACMADAGHAGYTSQTEAQNSVSEELNAFYENQTEWVENDPALAKIGEKEIALALVDLDCREKLDYTKKRLAATVKLEEQFIADHKAELDALKADAEQSR